MERTEVTVMPIRTGENGSVSHVAIPVKFYQCLMCGYQHQTEKQQALFTLEVYKHIPESELDAIDAVTIWRLKKIAGIEEPEEGDDEVHSEAID